MVAVLLLTEEMVLVLAMSMQGGAGRRQWGLKAEAKAPLAAEVAGGGRVGRGVREEWREAAAGRGAPLRSEAGKRGAWSPGRWRMVTCQRR